jgi:hypothetical protein
VSHKYHFWVLRGIKPRHMRTKFGKYQRCHPLKAPFKRKNYSCRKRSIFYPFRRSYQSRRDKLTERHPHLFLYRIFLWFAVSVLTAPVTHQDLDLQKNESFSSVTLPVKAGSRKSSVPDRVQETEKESRGRWF